MYTARHFPLVAAIAWTYEVLLAAGAWSVLVVVAYKYGGMHWLALPNLPVAVLGTAVSFYLGFKGNAAYGRMWEARQIWGSVVNGSRTFAVSLRDYVRPGEAEAAREVHRELVYRHLAWLTALRTQLRRPRSWEHGTAFNEHYRRQYGTHDNGPAVLDARLTPYLAAEERVWVMARQNQATQLLAMQSRRLAELRAAGQIEAYPYVQLMRLIEAFYGDQGKCERIKNFPLPRQYTTANHWFVLTFIGAVPLAMVGAFAAMPDTDVWFSVPVSVVICWVFYLWDTVLDYSENPFEGLINDVPIDGLSRTIEIDLREILGETELPSPLPPVHPDVAM
jgi:putative membrane protein